MLVVVMRGKLHEEKGTRIVKTGAMIMIRSFYAANDQIIM